MIGTLSTAALAVSQSFELSLLLKATLVLLAASAVAALSRTARASVRHLVMASAFTALVAMPLLLSAIPQFSLDVPVRAAASPTIEKDIALPEEPREIAAPAIRSTTPQAGAWSLVEWMRVTWIAGTVLFLLPIGAVLWRLSMIRRTGIPVAWHRAELLRLADARGVSTPVELLEHEAVPGPMTFGISRPVIVLPPDAREWSEAELRRALMHEIEHIQRGDWIMQIVARTVAAFYWFHPMVWSALRRLCLEAERACDDAVVIGEERTEYAEQLVSLAQRMSATPVQPMLGMANRSDLSTRVTAVLDERLHRGRAGFAIAAGTLAAAAIVVLTVAPVRAVAVIPELPSTPPTVAAAAADRVDDQENRALLRKIESARRESIERRERRKARAIDRALYEAANEGEFDEVKDLVAAGANPSATIDGDGNALIGAARSGRADISRFLLDQGADPNGIVPGDGSPLIAACQNGRLDQVRLLVDRGADVNLAVDGDENPLMNAAEGGHLAIVQYLVSKGADVHTRIKNERYDGDSEWRTAISQARKNGHSDVVRYLQSVGARDDVK